jgi:short-subunit dehydrogenase
MASAPPPRGAWRRRGFSLALVARRQGKLTELVDELKAAHRAEVETLTLDVGT